MVKGTYVRLRLLEDEKAPPALVEHAMEDFVEDHLRQLELDSLPSLSYLLRDVLNLDDGVGLDDAEEVLLEKRIVQCGEMRADRCV